MIPPKQQIIERNEILSKAEGWIEIEMPYVYARPASSRGAQGFELGDHSKEIPVIARRTQFDEAIS